MTRWFNGWLLSLRIARRDARRARGRSALVFVMIALPVLAVVALDVLGRTADVSTAEGIDRRLGRADALVTSAWSGFQVDQTPDASSVSVHNTPGGAPTSLSSATVAANLPDARRVLELRQGEVAVRTDDGLARPLGHEVDLRDSLTTGMFRLTAGRLPSAPDEVVVTGRLAGRGFEVGRTLTWEAGGTRSVVGTVESTSERNVSAVVGPRGSLDFSGGAGATSSWLVDAPDGVSWQTVRALNTKSMVVLSRAVVLNPPPADEVTFGSVGGGPGAAEVAVLAMIVAMALLQVVLLAGPAFAVGARRQQRALALIIATGGEARHVRRVVLASGVFIGAVASASAAVAGIAIAWFAQPLVQRVSGTVLGPFEVNARDVVIIAACGLLSAVLAALVPAVVAARQDVVAALAGRRGQGRPALWSPLLGALLLAAGITGAVIGATRASGGETYITGSAVLAVLGMVLLAPLAVSLSGRLAKGLPLPARFAVRDAARQRSRTAPAVAAVAATVAGVVALGIGAASDAAENRATYSPTGPPGDAVVAAYGASAQEWADIRAAVDRHAPDAEVTEVLGLTEVFEAKTGQLDTATTLTAEAAGRPSADASFGSGFGASMLVGARSLDALGLDLSAAERANAHRVLEAGGVVLFAYTDTGVRAADVTRVELPVDGSEPRKTGHWRVPAVEVRVPGSMLPAVAVLSDELVRRTDVTARTSGLVVEGPFGTDAEDAMREGVTGAYPDSSVAVERGYRDDTSRVVLLLLGVVGGVLVLGGTLTATFLALSDARPDFATLSAVGAAPRTRRLVAASYAGAVGLLGALLGAAVGFIPGIAIAYPLTANTWTRPPGAARDIGPPLPDVFIDIPWLLVTALVVGLPLVAALGMGLVTRSRLPMVSRLS